MMRGNVAGEESEGEGHPRMAATAEPVGELVQWDTCDHDWLEGRGERVYLMR